MKAFVESQFGYCPLIWMFHSRRLNNKINRIHERALRITYKDKSSTFQELLEKDNSVSTPENSLHRNGGVPWSSALMNVCTNVCVCVCVSASLFTLI